MRSGWIVNSGVVYIYQFEPDWDPEDISEEDCAEPVQAWLLQFFSIVYTQILVLETQWPQHVTHSPTPWTNSAKLQAQFLLYTQIAVLKHSPFFKTLHTILCFWHNFHAENILFSQGTHCHSNTHWIITRANTRHTVLQLAIRALA